MCNKIQKEICSSGSCLHILYAKILGFLLPQLHYQKTIEPPLLWLQSCSTAIGRIAWPVKLFGQILHRHIAGEASAPTESFLLKLQNVAGKKQHVSLCILAVMLQKKCLDKIP